MLRWLEGTEEGGDPVVMPHMTRARCWVCMLKGELEGRLSLYTNVSGAFYSPRAEAETGHN